MAGTGFWQRRLPWLREVNGATLRADALAALLGATLVLPQGIAFAALAGLPPSMGLIAAVLPAVLAALVGSSRQVVTGPTNASSLALGAMLVPLTAGDTTRLVPLALMATLLVGVLQTALALARLGRLANFISPSVLLGFTSGAAALIAWYALAGMMGGVGRASPLQVWASGAAHWAPLLVGGATLAAAVAGRHWWRRWPYLLLALVLGTVLGLPLEPLARVGPAASAWPQWQLPLAQPAVWWPLLADLLPVALALCVVTLGQSMAIAKALAQRTGDTLDANRECLGQGLANLGAACTGGLVVCGSLNRSLPNLEAGARTPLAAVLSGLMLPLLVALAAPALARIPMAAVAGLLLLVAWTLWDRAGWGRLWQLDRSEFLVALATAGATLALPLEVAVLSGVLLSLVVYLWRTARPALRSMGFDRQGAQRPFVVLDQAPQPVLPECPQLKLLRMEGAVWFGAVAHVADHLRDLRQAPALQPHLLVMAKSMNFIDLAAADLWDDERLRRRAAGGDLYFHRPRPQVMAMWRQTGFVQRLGEDHLFPDKRSAIAAIVRRLDPEVCRGCQVRLFEECAERPGAPLAPTI